MSWRDRAQPVQNVAQNDWRSRAQPVSEGLADFAATHQAPSRVIQEMHPDLRIRDRFATKNFSNSPDATTSYLQQRMPDHEIQFDPRSGQHRIKKQGERDWRVVDPDTGFFSKDFLYDAGDVAWDVPAAVAEGTAAAAGALKGAALTLPLMGSGALPGAMLVGGGAAAGLETVRQKLGQALGINEELDGGQVGTAGAFGLAGPLSFGAGKAKGLVQHGYSFARDKMFPTVSQFASGIPKNATRTMMDNYDEVSKRSADDILTEVKNFRTEAGNTIQSSQREAGEAYGQSLTQAGPIDTSDVRQVLFNEVENRKQTYLRTKGQKDYQAWQAAEREANDFFRLANPDNEAINRANQSAYEQALLEQQRRAAGGSFDHSNQVLAQRGKEAIDERGALSRLAGTADKNINQLEDVVNLRLADHGKARSSQYQALSRLANKSDNELMSESLKLNGQIERLRSAGDTQTVERLTRQKQQIDELIRLGAKDRGRYVQQISEVGDGLLSPRQVDEIISSGRVDDISRLSEADLLAVQNRVNAIGSTGGDVARVTPARGGSGLSNTEIDEIVLGSKQINYGALTDDDLLRIQSRSAELREGSRLVSNVPEHLRRAVPEPDIQSTRMTSPVLEGDDILRFKNRMDSAAEMYNYRPDLASRHSQRTLIEDKQWKNTFAGATKKLNEMLDSIPGADVGANRARYAKTAEDLKYLNRYFKDEEATYRTLSSLDNKSRAIVKAKLKRIDKDYGLNLSKTADIIEAHKYFGKDASLVPLSIGGSTSTSRSIPLAAAAGSAGSLAGYKMGGGYAGAAAGGGIGALIGGALGSPGMIKGMAYLVNQAEKAGGITRQAISEAARRSGLPEEALRREAIRQGLQIQGAEGIWDMMLSN